MGKRTIDTDNSKSLLYFKKSINNLQEIKKNFINSLDSNKLNILNTTEIDCKKILSKYDNVFNLITTSDLNSIKKIHNINLEK